MMIPPLTPHERRMLGICLAGGLLVLVITAVAALT